jgi:hypothetical protein
MGLCRYHLFLQSNQRFAHFFASPSDKKLAHEPFLHNAYNSYTIVGFASSRKLIKDLERLSAECRGADCKAKKTAAALTTIHNQRTDRYGVAFASYNSIWLTRRLQDPGQLADRDW